MANIDNAFRIDKVSLSDKALIVEGSIDPSDVGYEAPIGSLYLNDITGETYHKIDTADTDWISSGNIDPNDAFNVFKTPIGFVNRTDSHMSFDDISRTLTISVQSPATSYDYYIFGQKYTITSDKSVSIPNISGLYYFHMGSDEELHYSILDGEDWFINNPMISIIYWNADMGTITYMADERHTVLMDGITHWYLHSQFGARYISGLGISGVVPNTETDAAVQIEVEAGEIRDEDLLHHIVNVGNKINIYDLEQNLYPIAQLPVYYRVGATGEWYYKPANDFPFLHAGITGYTGTRIPYNEWTGTTWQLTELSNNRFGAIHIYATNNIHSPIIVVQGIQSYQNKPTSQDLASIELKAILGLPFAECVPIASIIFSTADSHSNTYHITYEYTSDGDLYVDWRFISVATVQGIGPTDHSTLTGLTNDDHLQYALAGSGSTRTFDFGDLYNISDISHTSADNGFVYGLKWDDVNSEYDVTQVPSGTWLLKSSAYTAVPGDNIVADTNGSAFTITLPAAPVFGDTIRIKDSRGSFSTNNLTIDRNGSNIAAVADNLVLDLNYADITLVYQDITVGWTI